MKHSRTLTALLAGALLLVGVAGAQASTVTCESRDGSLQSCPVKTSGGVRLARQLSSQGCWQNDTWGYDSQRIWVTHGCRAEFDVGSAARSANTGNAIAAAAVVGLAAAAVIANNQNDHHGHHNRRDDDRYSSHDYYDRRYDQYDRTNDYGRYGYNGYGGDPRRTFICESRNDRRNFCSIPKRGHVEVYRQLSSRSCSHGRSWGVQGGEVWVDDGCRAEFAVY